MKIVRSLPVEAETQACTMINRFTDMYTEAIVCHNGRYISLDSLFLTKIVEEKWFGKDEYIFLRFYREGGILCRQIPTLRVEYPDEYFDF